jgi:hypothetical protein
MGGWSRADGDVGTEGCEGWSFRCCTLADDENCLWLGRRHGCRLVREAGLSFGVGTYGCCADGGCWRWLFLLREGGLGGFVGASSFPFLLFCWTYMSQRYE